MHITQLWKSPWEVFNAEELDEWRRQGGAEIFLSEYDPFEFCAYFYVILKGLVNCVIDCASDFPI